MALKKRIFVILAVCMAVTLLAGCGAANREEALPADSNAAVAEDVLVAGDMEKPDEGLEGEPVRPVVTPEEDGIEVERRPWYEDEAAEPIIIKVPDFFIEQAKTQVHWDYYAHTAEQDPETGGWTVTFWSQDREKFQVVIGCQFGIGQTVQLPANQEEAITIADAYKTFAYYAATAEQDPETGDWTVTFWSRDRETSQMVIVSEFRPVLVEPAVEQASILHKLMEIDWEGKTGEARPWYEEEIIAKAAEQIQWNYYVATAVQNAETGEWTVTFWSRSRMDSQVVIVDRYGGVLEVKAGTFLSENE